ncbi:hypothetical protein SUGI_0097480 [Cryptomeria japonica]|uniref:plant UBX domain-containing protein 10 n=1 Tax=Cryptomeria japonica TaxID=3369 RepID=UPI002408B83E|nr:plant UBX domain-containing protein 10 [Cryptomeria japonica]GLJ08877.1 hypothetical protein SUGI_0097480 [Cryptomeria japonica]
MDNHGLRDPLVGNGDNRGWRDHQQQVGSSLEPQSSCAAMMAKIISLPSSIIGGVSKAVGYGMTVAGGVLSHIGMGRRHGGPQRIQQQNAFVDPFSSYVQNDEPPVIPIQSEALAFIINFEQQYGHYHPSFVESNFIDALRRAKDEYKFLFVYLHYPDHPHTNIFCQNTLCSELVVQYLNASFVCWGATVNSSEGFRMCNALQATTFPFCALVTSASYESLAVLQQVEGPVPSEALVEILQRALEEQGSALMNERLKEEDGILSNRQLRENQDAAYQATLRADKERDQRTQLQSGHVSKKSEDKERKKPAEKELQSQFHGKENAPANGIQPEKGPNVTQILIRFPNGDRKEHRFLCTDKVHSIYKYVDSLGLVGVGSYKLIATFPRREYGFEKMNFTLKEAGLHPQASLYLEVSNKQ